MGEAMRALAILMVVVGQSALAEPVFAAEKHHPMDQGFHAVMVGRHMDAAEIAAERLEEDPSDLEAHQLYQAAWYTMGDGGVLDAQYRNWVESESESETARVALAMLLFWFQRKPDLPDDEIRDLLDPLPESPEARFYALFMLRSLDAKDDDEAPWVARSVEMCDVARASGLPRLQRAAAILRLRVQVVDTEQSSAARKAVREQPALLSQLAYALWPELPDGPTAAGLRFFAENQAEKALQGEDAIRLYAAAEVFRAQEDLEGLQQCTSLLGELELTLDRPHPHWKPIYEATKRFDREVGLSELDELEDQIPASGEARIHLEETRARLLSKLGRKEDAHQARKRAMAVGADEPHSAISFAQSAARTRDDMDLALEYLDEVLQWLEAEDFDPQGEMSSLGYARWLDYHNRQIAQVLAARAALLVTLARPDDAAADLRRACALADRRWDHMSLALIYGDHGLEDRGYEHLVRAATLAEESRRDGPRSSSFSELLRSRWEARPYWHPGGLEGYMADRVTALAEEDRAPS